MICVVWFEFNFYFEFSNSILLRREKSIFQTIISFFDNLIDFLVPRFYCNLLAIVIVFFAFLWQFYGKYNRFYCDFMAETIDFVAIFWRKHSILLRLNGDFRAKNLLRLLRLCGDKIHFSGIIMQYTFLENNVFSFYYNRKYCLIWLHINDYNGNIFGSIFSI